MLPLGNQGDYYFIDLQDIYYLPKVGTNDVRY